MSVVHNEALRAHVTRVGFDLTLGKTHIAALVLLNESLRRNDWISTQVASVGYRRTFSLFVPGVHGLQDRGLVIHNRPERGSRKRLRQIWVITKAGKLVIDLLREAGIYQEYADALPRLEAVS